MSQALEELWQLHVGLRDRVVTEQGLLRQHVNIFLDGENIRRKELLETGAAREWRDYYFALGERRLMNCRLPIPDWRDEA